MTSGEPVAEVSLMGGHVHQGPRARAAGRQTCRTNEMRNKEMMRERRDESIKKGEMPG